ncbi:hypothetical protein H70357_03645 [Paenibacillus sp. FSL H7-0357]|nr:hypothetical protein H70357_03645 [Paenibacillus sp. FSL H7-0357]
MFVYPFRFCFIGAGRIGVRKLFEHTKDWFMRRSSLVTAALVVFMSSEKGRLGPEAENSNKSITL